MSVENKQDFHFPIMPYCVIEEQYIQGELMGYHGYSPSMPGVHVAGETKEETYYNLLAAMATYPLSVVKHRDSFPVDKPIVFDK